MTINVCLICTDDIARAGIGQILEHDGFRITGSFCKITDVVNDYINDEYLYLINVSNSDELLEGIECIIRINSDCRVIALSENFDLSSMIKCFQAGAYGYLVRSTDSTLLTASLKLAGAGKKVPPSEIIDLLDFNTFSSLHAEDNSQHFKDVNLSNRELDVLCCLMAGYSNKFIARQLGVCEATVKVHVKGILRKLNVSNRTQAALWANAHGMVEYSNTLRN